MEFPLNEHCFTWFRGNFMSHIDRAIANAACHMKFPTLAPTRYPKGLLDHCQLTLGSIIQN